MKYRGNKKYQPGGSRQADFYEQQLRDKEREEALAKMKQMQPPTRVREEDIVGPPSEQDQYPLPNTTGWSDPIQEGNAKSIIDLTPEQKQMYEDMRTKKPPIPFGKTPATPRNWRQSLGLGIMGVRTLLSEWSGRVARSRQNDYDAQQQLALYRLNAMPVSNFQPTYNNMYGKYGGLQHAKYFGPPFSNGAKMSMSDSDRYDKRYINSRVIPDIMNLYASRRKRYYQGGGQYMTFPGDTLTNNQIGPARRQYEQLMRVPGSGVEGNSPSFGRRVFNRVPLKVGDKLYQPSAIDSAKIHNYSNPTMWDEIADFVGLSSANIPAPINAAPKVIPPATQSSTYVRPNLRPMQAGGPIYTSNPNDPRLRAYQDSMTLHNLSKEQNQAALKYKDVISSDNNNLYASHPYFSKYQSEEWNSKFEKPYYNLTVRNGMSPTYHDTGKEVEAKGFAGNRYTPHEYTKPKQPVLYRKRTGPKAQIPTSNLDISIGERPEAGQINPPALYNPADPTKYSYTTAGEGFMNQQVTYLPDEKSWRSFLRGKKVTSSQQGADYGTATGLKKGGKWIPKDMKKGGIHIKKENRGKFTDYCGGKVTDDCIQEGLNSPSATIRKRANFARNARKWH